MDCIYLFRNNQPHKVLFNKILWLLKAENELKHEPKVMENWGMCEEMLLMTGFIGAACLKWNRNYISTCLRTEKGEWGENGNERAINITFFFFFRLCDIPVSNVHADVFFPSCTNCLQIIIIVNINNNKVVGVFFFIYMIPYVVNTHSSYPGFLCGYFVKPFRVETVSTDHKGRFITLSVSILSKLDIQVKKKFSLTSMELWLSIWAPKQKRWLEFNAKKFINCTGNLEMLTVLFRTCLFFCFVLIVSLCL